MLPSPQTTPGTLFRTLIRAKKNVVDGEVKGTPTEVSSQDARNLAIANVVVVESTATSARVKTTNDKGEDPGNLSCGAEGKSQPRSTAAPASALRASANVSGQTCATTSTDATAGGCTGSPLSHAFSDAGPQSIVEPRKQAERKVPYGTSSAPRRNGPQDEKSRDLSWMTNGALEQETLVLAERRIRRKQREEKLKLLRSHPWVEQDAASGMALPATQKSAELDLKIVSPNPLRASVLRPRAPKLKSTSMWLSSRSERDNESL